ncbi:putative methyltransferase [Citrobacter koseri]|nr:putative methyltransferase [Citrobacter koseri]
MNVGFEPQYFGDESKKIIHGDALSELKKLPPESADLIFADPPYNIGKNFDGLVESWDEETFLAWLFECIDECHRVLKKHGTMYIMNSTEKHALSRPQMQETVRYQKPHHMVVRQLRRAGQKVFWLNV